MQGNSKIPDSHPAKRQAGNQVVNQPTTWKKSMVFSVPGNQRSRRSCSASVEGLERGPPDNSYFVSFLSRLPSFLGKLFLEGHLTLYTVPRRDERRGLEPNENRENQQVSRDEKNRGAGRWVERGELLTHSWVLVPGEERGMGRGEAVKCDIGRRQIQDQ